MLNNTQQREANLIIALAGMYELRSNMTNSEFVAAKNSQITALLNIIGGKSKKTPPTPALGNGEISMLQQTKLLGKTLCVYGSAENPLFLANDIAEWLEHSNARMMLQSVDEDEKVVNNVYTPGGKQECWFLTENGLYEVLMLSRKPIAKDFKKGVKKILKEIRQKGYYANKTADNEIEVLCHSKIFEKILCGYADTLKRCTEAEDDKEHYKDLYEDLIKYFYTVQNFLHSELQTVLNFKKFRPVSRFCLPGEKPSGLQNIPFVKNAPEMQTKVQPAAPAKVAFQPEKIHILIKMNWKGNPLTIFGTEQRPLFFSKDVAQWFGLTSSNMIKQVSEANKEIHSNPCNTTCTRSWFITAEGVKELFKHYVYYKNYKTNIYETEFDNLIKTIKK